MSRHESAGAKLGLLLTTVVGWTPVVARAQPADPDADRIDALEARVEALEKDRDVDEAPDEGKARVEAWPPAIESSDGRHRLEVHARVHLDLHADPSGRQFDPEFVVRRARLGVRARTFDRFTLKLDIEVGKGEVGLRDAFVEIEATKWLRVRVGQQLVPFSLMRLTSSNWIVHPERPIVVEKLNGPRDVGVMVDIDPWPDHVAVQLGVFNGNGQAGDGDIDLPFDLVARVRVDPSPWLTFDTAYRWSPPDDETDLPRDAATMGGELVDILVYDRELAFRDGSRHRGQAGARARAGALELRAEGLVERTEDAQGPLGSVSALTDWGAFADIAYNVTGEEAHDGDDDPQRPLHVDAGQRLRGVGAWQLAARYELFVADEDAINAGVATGSDLAHGPTASVVWWFVPGTRWMLSYGYTRFDDQVGKPRAATDAHAIISRLDMHF